MLTPYLLYIKIAAVALLLGGVFAYGHHVGYQGEHDKLVTLSAQVETIGKAQAEQVKIADAQKKEAANAADQNAAYVANSIAQYYHDHPAVRVRNTCSGSSSPAQAADNSKVSDGSTASADAPAFVSEYDPEQVELVAARLDGLQKLLIQDGVTIK